MGLGSSWNNVLEVLEDIIPVYDKVNSHISLGKDVEHRTRGITGRVKTGDMVLDAGSGFGNMSKTSGSFDIASSSHPESTNLAVLPIGFRRHPEELRIFLVGKRVSTFNVLETQRVEFLSDEQLVL